MIIDFFEFTCDNCGKKTKNPKGWYEIEITIGEGDMADEYLEKHACSEKCAIAVMKSTEEFK